VNKELYQNFVKKFESRRGNTRVVDFGGREKAAAFSKLAAAATTTTTSMFVLFPYSILLAPP
jgi:hypothetical protein